MADTLNNPSLLDLTFSGLQELLVQSGLKPSHAAVIWRLLYRGSWDGESRAPRLAATVHDWWDHHRPLPVASLGRSVATDEFSEKYTIHLLDEQVVESVAMRYPGRNTACLSTQVGCAMGCQFCATGQMGFRRHLQPSEIVAQALLLQSRLMEAGVGGLRNIVLMGMGEPLHNYEAVMTALDILTDTRGLNLGPKRVTLSTVGYVPGILRMAEERRPYRLALSLHAADDALRQAMIPVAHRWPLGELIEACRIYQRQTGKRIFVEWTLVEGVNDSREQAAQLIEVLHGLDAHINLIPLNRTAGYRGEPSGVASGQAFQRAVKAGGFPATIRQARGLDIAAGCGQLAGAV